MAEYIDRDSVLAAIKDNYEPIDADFPMTLRLEDIGYSVKTIPAADVVPKAVFEQVRWERDTAISQLRKDYGVELGERKKQF